MKERSGKERERRRGGGGAQGGVRRCKARSQSHEPGWVGVRVVSHPGNIYKHTVDIILEKRKYENTWVQYDQGLVLILRIKMPNSALE